MSAHTPAYEPATLENCEDEPIHVPGAIQPHGLLLAVDGTERIVATSTNTETMLGRDVQDVRGRWLSDVLGDAVAATVRQAAAEPERSVARRVELESGGLLGRSGVDLIAHRSGRRVVIELEPVEHEVETITYRTARSAVARLAGCRTVRDLCEQLAVEVRALTGFDRVMVYRFDEEWNGEVVAEERRGDLEPFRGLHYPAGDIPAQARRLYTENWIRSIPDVGYVPVPLDPTLEPAEGALDLSHSVLRSVSPIHLEYLGNMGVAASMSVSMIADGRLWGLVACHHYAGPHQVAAEARSAAEFLGQTASQLILDRVRSDERAAALLAEHELTALMARLGPEQGPVRPALAADRGTQALVDASAVAICDGADLWTAGDGPAEPTLRRIAALLQVEDGRAVATDRLAGLDPELIGDAARASGALMVATGPEQWVLWLRPAQERTVDWAGDPRRHDDESAPSRLTPRSSFERWREVVRDRSLPWETWQLDIAERLQERISRELARRSREHATVAESLHRVLVPGETPQVPGFDVAARYRPAAEVQLGGDWWDVFALPDGRTAVAVGDVSGHGVDATAVMAQVRTGLRAYAIEGHSPSETLDRLDRFVADLLPGRTATALLAVLDPADGTLEVANAGHLPLIRRRADGVGEVSPGGGPLLGAGIGRASTEHIGLAAGDIVLLYTDGLIEQRDVPIDERVLHLRAAVESHRASSVDAWLDQLIVAVPGSGSDDLTVVAVQRSVHDGAAGTAREA